jgi:hypothetical protein
MSESKDAKSSQDCNELPMGVTHHHLKRANSVELRSLMGMIEQELLRRSKADPYIIVEVPADKQHLIIQEAMLIEDEDGNPRYAAKKHHGPTMNAQISNHSVFHQQHHVGNVFEITLEGNVVNVAKRVATHL